MAARRSVLVLGAWIALTATAAGAERPAQLGCVERHFAVKAALVGDAWHLVGTNVDVTWRRGALRAFADALDDPDVADMFVQPYPTGPIVPVTVADQDPGRIRVESLFRLTYPKKDLRKTTFFGHPITLHGKVLPSLARVEARLQAASKDPDVRQFLSALGGGYNDRVIAGTQRRSAHAFGLAIDLNPKPSHYWRWQKGGWKNAVPQSLVDAFEAEGWIWGGRWFHFDTMHFEYRPELFDPACRLS